MHDKNYEAHYSCECGATYTSDIPFEKLFCLNCGKQMIKMKLIYKIESVKFYRDDKDKLFQDIGDGVIIPVTNGDMKYKNICTKNGYKIRYNLNGVHGYSIWNKVANLEDRIWSKERAIEIASEM